MFYYMRRQSANWSCSSHFLSILLQCVNEICLLNVTVHIQFFLCTPVSLLDQVWKNTMDHIIGDNLWMAAIFSLSPMCATSRSHLWQICLLCGRLSQILLNTTHPSQMHLLQSLWFHISFTRYELIIAEASCFQTFSNVFAYRFPLIPQASSIISSVYCFHFPATPGSLTIYLNLAALISHFLFSHVFVLIT